MKFFKKFLACLIIGIMAVTSFTVAAGAALDLYPDAVAIKSGKEVTGKLVNNEDSIIYKLVCSGKGELNINYMAKIGRGYRSGGYIENGTVISIIDTKGSTIYRDKVKIDSGYESSYGYLNYDNNTGVFSGELTYNLSSKGTYYIKILRHNADGSGEYSITATFPTSTTTTTKTTTSTTSTNTGTFRLTLYEEDSIKLDAVFPTTSTTAVTWSTSDKTVARVTTKGRVVAVSEGNAVITATRGTEKMKIRIRVISE